MTLDGAMLGAIMAASFALGYLWHWAKSPKKWDVKRLQASNDAKAAELLQLRRQMADPLWLPHHGDLLDESRDS